MDLVLNIDTLDLPRVAVLKPVVRDLDLGAVLDDLAEDAVLVADPVAPGRVVESGHRVQETCR
jgi:hypothetical protein